MAFEIREDDLSGLEIAALLRRHLEHAATHSPRAVLALRLHACAPFANYRDDPNSLCMTLELEP